jgi:2-methylisocitrate lyase-like PEP mutase family enzyme
VFVPGLADPRELEQVVDASSAPVNALLAPGGPTVGQLGSLGVARVSCGSLLFRIALGAATDALRRAAAGSDLAALPSIAYDDVQALAAY